MIELKVNDMTCGHCVKTITKAVTALDPAAKVEADIEAKRVRIESTHSASELTQALGAAGYPASAV
ncbi:MAG: heavy-metal-associated domain-containing protein [Betaproteobacteria bacterium]|nr:heavy-metal-associated domain-containing protein [Betaproteobacteria bacterium]